MDRFYVQVLSKDSGYTLTLRCVRQGESNFWNVYLGMDLMGCYITEELTPDLYNRLING